MYFWNIQKLKQDLLERKFSDKEIFPYFFALSLVTVLATIPFFESNGWDIFNAFLSGFITLFGVWYVYRVNGGAQGSDFLARYFSIGWVTLIRFFVFVFLPVIVFWIIMMIGVLSSGVLSYEDSEKSFLEGTNFLDSMTVFFLEGAYLWMIAKHVREVAKKSLQPE